MSEKLPPGQYELKELPRFGQIQFADRFPRKPNEIELKIKGDIATPILLSEEIKTLPRIQQTSDFHCVTTWSVRSLTWSGFLFSDFFEQIIMPMCQPEPKATFVMFRCQDGYVTSLPLSDLLAQNVLLADRLHDEPLPIAHGAPLRLIAPAHYGYKNAKHIKGIEFWSDERHYPPSVLRFMDHPRARVDLEERGRGIPGWLLRYLYRPLVRPATRKFQQTLNKYLDITPQDK